MLCPTCNQPSIERTFYECPNEHSWWMPNPGPQTRFLETTAHEVLYGGAAGGGKSAALVMGALRWIGNPHYKGVIIRRQTGHLEELIDLAREWYPRVEPGVRPKADGKAATFHFASGAKIIFGHCKDEADYLDYQGKQYQYIGFDELTHFTVTQYLKIKSRIRAAHGGLRRFLRSTSNPGGPGHEWVLERWGAWLNPKFCDEYEAPGLVRRYSADGVEMPPLASGQVVWIEKGKNDTVERYLPGRPSVIDEERHGSRTFIGAKVSDNRVLMTHDPGYVRNLADLDAVTRAQLADGDWLIKPAKGMYFKRGWWKLVDAVPAQGLSVRYWDRAASVDTGADWTVGLLMIRVGDEYWIKDIVRLQGSPGEVERTILNTATLDGKGVKQVLERDPGAAGKSEIFQYSKILAGFDCHFPQPSGDKVTRAKPLSAQVEAGNVRLIRAKFTEKFVQELESFPEDTHDDQVDAASGAFITLLRMGGGSNAAAGVRKTAPPDPQNTPLG